MWQRTTPDGRPVVFKCVWAGARVEHLWYSNARDKQWQTAALSGTQRIRAAISERASAIC